MSKKDYIALAKLIVRFNDAITRVEYDYEAQADCVARELVVPLAHMLKADNPNFDYSRFLAACGVKAEVA
jgi:hypothetical protein